MPEAHPLQWPPGQPRTRVPIRSVFGDHTFAKARDAVLKELKRMNAKHPVISTNVELRLDGVPYANRRNPEDPGVAVYCTIDDQPYCFPCDHYTRITDNMWAIAKHLEATRAIARWGVGTANQVFAGFKALPAKGETSVGDHWARLKLDPATATAESVQKKFRELALSRHPDHGGSDSAMARLTEAKALCLNEIATNRS